MSGLLVQSGSDFLEWDTNIFFNSKEYLLLHGNTYKWFKLKRGGYCVAQLIFTIDGKRALSPNRAPYGGLEIIEDCLPNEIDRFLTTVLTELKTVGVEEVVISNLPDFYSGFEWKNDFYHSITTDTNYYYSTENPKKYNSTKRNIVKQLIQKGFACKESNAIEKAYFLIATHYNDKSFPLTMSLDELLEAFKKFPNNYKLYGCFDSKEEMCAAIFCVNVNKELQYLMYNGVVSKYYKDSPLVLLYDFMIGQAKRNNIKFIDYGIASVDGKLNEGLAFFKESMGGISSDKTKYSILL